MPSDKDIKPTAAVKPTAAQLITYWAEQNRLLKDEVASLKALLSDASAAKFKELSDHMKSLQAQVEGSGYMDVWAVLHKEQDAKAAKCKVFYFTLKDKVKALTAQVEALKADAPKQIVSVKKEPTEVGDAVPRLASHANYPTKRSRPSPSASSGASSGAAGGAAGGAAEGVAGQGFSEICPLTKCLVSQCLHCRPLSDM